MEYSQELDTIKQEVENSSQKLEELSESLRGLTKLQESITNLQENNVLNRIEAKIDILAQTDNFELLNFSLENLKTDLTKKNDNLSQKINDGNHLINQLLTEKASVLVGSASSGFATKETQLLTEISGKIENLSEKFSCLSQYTDFYKKLNSLCSVVEEVRASIEAVSEESDVDLIKGKINYISTKVNEYIESANKQPGSFESPSGFENIQGSLNSVLEKLKNNSSFFDASLKDLSFLKENFLRINEKFSEINLLIKTSSGENEELNNRFEANLTHFNSCFKKMYEQFNNLENTFTSNFKDFKVCIQDVYDQFSTIDTRSEFNEIKLYVQTFSNKILSIAEVLETLKGNGFSVNLGKLDVLDQRILEESQIIRRDVNSISNKMSDEFASLAAPLASAIEMTCELNESLKEIFSRNEMEVQRETREILNKFENVCRNTENHFDSLFSASKQFYEKLEEVKSEFSNISYDTNSKINEFISKSDIIDLKIQNSLANSETAVNTLKDISKFAENQINANSESINSLSNGIYKLSEGFDAFKNDYSEINTKLNKIIINDKENVPFVKESFENLKEEINKTVEEYNESINETSKKLVKSLLEEFKEVNRKIQENSEISADNLKTTEDIKNAIVYTAEWFDKAGKIIEENNINIKRNSIEKIDSLMKRAEENTAEQIKRISDKLNRFEIRMESIEGKVEKLYSQQNSREMMSMLSDILEKVELSNERSRANELILRRIESLELKLEEIDTKKAARDKNLTS